MPPPPVYYIGHSDPEIQESSRRYISVEKGCDTITIRGLRYNNDKRTHHMKDDKRNQHIREINT